MWTYSRGGLLHREDVSPGNGAIPSIPGGLPITPRGGCGWLVGSRASIFVERHARFRRIPSFG